MFSTFGISVSLRQTKVNDVNIVLSLANSNEEVIWFDVSVKKESGVNVLYSLNHLISEHEDSLQRELSLAVIEEVF